MWMWRWKNCFPERYKVMSFLVAIAFGLLACIVGLVWWIVDGFKSVEALILAITGAAIFAFFLFLIKNRIFPEFKKLQNKEEE